ncbi:uncharacterized protein RCC_04261 [Ramularia collo-cygni]|uniref:Coenzyme Q-binding protein COQ10 START domain-containing protein n=1 Tax=Ramularia collo-cygni TaxID=112498 RepID=A0A2D3V4F3_9PEZI|nr:uncharacterized protein RCC_04261 [Ramularia collo-cygni]CZT18416.1 uncharacterized protein RCC_04261 [Ramularia collo-cygni]
MKSITPIANAILQSSARQTLQPCRAAHLANALLRSTAHEQQRRNFLPNPFTQNQTLTATRTLQYPSSIIFDIISDVNTYNQFLPFCQGSEVTKTSQPAEDGKTYPEEAKLVVGFNSDIKEEFYSRIYCVPGRIVEAVSGKTRTTLPADSISHHNARPSADHDPSQDTRVMAHLLTRWTLKPYPYKPPPHDALHKSTYQKNVENTNPLPGQQKTEVNLAIEFQFSNPLYAALSQAAAPKVAEKMIEAFEKRVRAVVEGPGHVKK